MTDFTHHTPRLLSDADAAADLAGVPRPGDLPSVGTEDAPGRLSTAGDCGDWSASHDGLGSSCYQALKDDAGTVIALVVAYDRSVYSDPDTRTNARRLVGCWNACDGMSTEDIERLANIDHAVMRLTVQADDYRRQRDELAARVREMEGERDRLTLSKIDRECLRIGQEIQRAAGELPDNYEIQIEVERGSGSVYLSKPDYTAVGFHDMVDGLSHAITQAIDAALASKEQP